MAATRLPRRSSGQLVTLVAVINHPLQMTSRAAPHHSESSLSAARSGRSSFLDGMDCPHVKIARLELCAGVSSALGSRTSGCGQLLANSVHSFIRGVSGRLTRCLTGLALGRGGGVGRVFAGMSALTRPNVLLPSLSSSRPTFLFVAGLDGTGHHFWADALASCAYCVPAPKSQAAAFSLWYDKADTPDPVTGKHSKSSCQTVAEAGRALVEGAATRSFPTKSNSSTLSRCPTDLDIPKQAAGGSGRKQALVEAIRTEAAGFKPGTVAALNLLGSGARMMSYPAMGLRNCCPNVETLAQAAAEANANFAVLVLTRDPLAAYYSDRTRFGDKHAYDGWKATDPNDPTAGALAIESYLLLEQVKFISGVPAVRWASIRYEHTVADAARADRLLGPVGDATFATYARKSFAPSHGSPPPAPPSSAPSLSIYTDCNNELVSMGEANSPS